MRILSVAMSLILAAALASAANGQWMGLIPLEKPKAATTDAESVKMPADPNKPPPPPMPTDGIDRRASTKMKSPAPARQANAWDNEPVVLDCWRASWCTACPQMYEIVDQLYREGWPIGWADYDQHRETAQGWGVTNLPTFVTHRKYGPLIQRCEGITTYEVLLKMLQDAGAVRGSPRASSLQQAPSTYSAQPSFQTSWGNGPVLYNSPMGSSRNGGSRCPPGRCPGGKCPTPGGW